MQLQRIILGMGVLLIVAGGANAVDWGRPPGGVLQAIRDMRLTLQARGTLRQDSELKRLGVEVKGGVAHVWGPVADRIAERRAVSRLELIVGILDVKTDCHYARPAPPVGEAFAASKVDLPTPVKERRGLSPVIPPPAPPALRRKVVATPVNLHPMAALADQVRAARKGDTRFAAVRVLVNGNNIIVYRDDDEDAASLFAQRLQTLSGVEAVILANR